MRLLGLQIGARSASTTPSLSWLFWRVVAAEEGERFKLLLKQSRKLSVDPRHLR